MLEDTRARAAANRAGAFRSLCTNELSCRTHQRTTEIQGCYPIELAMSREDAGQEKTGAVHGMISEACSRGAPARMTAGLA